MRSMEIYRRRPWASANSCRDPMGRRSAFDDPRLVDTVVRMSGVQPFDDVLVIGPGIDYLVEVLVKAEEFVTVVVKDHRAAAKLKRRCQGYPFSRHLEIIVGDALKMDLPFCNVCFANIPSQMSSQLTFKLLSSYPSFNSAVIMFQRDFAMRLLANPGDKLYCRQSVNFQFLAHASDLLKVGHKKLRLPPKVDFSIVRVKPRKALPSGFKEWDGLVSICFTQRDKSLSSIFSQRSVLSWLKRKYEAFQARKASMLTPTESDLGEVEDAFSSNTDGYMNSDSESESEDGEDEMDDEKEADDAVCSFRCKVMQVLRQGDFSELRPCNLSEVDFLHLLFQFNEVDIHFD